MRRTVTPIHRFVPLLVGVEEVGEEPLLRYDPKEGIIEGYAFVNERVGGENGVRLKRAAMEAATPGFLQYGTGALRSMHQPIAAGTVPLVKWDDKGAYVRAEVVDPVEKEKCERGVYKGLSVGVLPELMRGKDVERCNWFELSLVDRPKDPDAVITLYRAEGVPEEIEVEDLGDEPELRAEGETSDEAPTRENLDEPGRLHGKLHYDCGADTCHGHRQHAAALRCAQGRQSEAVLDRDDAPADPEVRGPGMGSALRGDLLTRLEASQAETATVRAELAAARERIERLEQEPVRGRQPVAYAAAVDRTFLANLASGGGAEDAATVEALRGEWNKTRESIEELKRNCDRDGLQAAGAKLIRLQTALTVLGERL